MSDKIEVVLLNHEDDFEPGLERGREVVMECLRVPFRRMIELFEAAVYAS